MVGRQGRVLTAREAQNNAISNGLAPLRKPPIGQVVLLYVVVLHLPPAFEQQQQHIDGSSRIEAVTTLSASAVTCTYFRPISKLRYRKVLVPHTYSNAILTSL